MAKPLHATSNYPKGHKLKRVKWLLEGLIRKAKGSYWAPFIGSGDGGKGIRVVTDFKKFAGEKIIFDYDGYLTGGLIRRPATLLGTGEDLRQFSDSLELARWGKEVNNGRKWEAWEIDRDDSAVKTTARDRLSELLTRLSDQAYFDMFQIGASSLGTHAIHLTSLSSNDFIDVNQILGTGIGYNAGMTSPRMPLNSFGTDKAGNKYYFFIDAHIKAKHFKDVNTQNVYLNGGTRGENNPMFSHATADFGQVMMVEAPSFMGSSNGAMIDADGYYNFDNIVDLQNAGMRVYNPTAPAGTTFVVDKWQGETGFSWTSPNGIIAVGFIVGKSALNKAVGLGDLEWHYQESTDYGVTSTTAVEISQSVKIAMKTAENGDYDIPEAGVPEIIPVHIRIK